MHHFTKCSPSRLKRSLVGHQQRNVLCLSAVISSSFQYEPRMSTADWLTQNGCLGLREAVSQSSSSLRHSKPFYQSPCSVSLVLIQTGKRLIKRYNNTVPSRFTSEESHTISATTRNFRFDPLSPGSQTGITLWKCNPGLGVEGIKEPEDTM